VCYRETSAMSAFYPSWLEMQSMLGTQMSTDIPFSGIQTQPFSIPSGSPLNVTGTGFTTDRMFIENKHHPEGLTNAPVNHHLMLRLPLFPLNDIGQGELMFTVWSERNSQRIDGFHQVKSLSSLNVHLATPGMRIKYGSQKHCDQLMTNFKLYGIAQRDFADQNVHAFHVGGVVERVYNIWNACGRDVTINSRLYVLVRREPYQSILEAGLNRTRSSSYKRLATEASKTSAVSFRNPDSLSKKDEGEKEYVWGYYPWVTNDGVDPPSILYQNTEFQGACIFIGTVIKLYENHDRGGLRYGHRMRNAVFPKKADAEYREDLKAGNVISVALRRN